MDSLTNNLLFYKSSAEKISASAQGELNAISFLTKDEHELISSYISLNGTTKILKTKSALELNELNDNFGNIVNLHRINNIRWVNKFFELVNNKLPQDGIFIGCVETYEERSNRINKKYPRIIADAFYGLSFIYNRVIPKLVATRKIYFSITKGNNRVLSKAETLGRLISCGFEILGYKKINTLLYFVCKKVKKPAYDLKPSYGIFIKMQRIGQNGRIINVYKMRTMHPYAEYLQEYIFKQNDLDEGGKFKNDFRITYWGRIFRKFWIDELPMIINWFKRDLKLVGCRPLSNHYFGLYTPEFRERRLKYKPGLIPPYYVDLPKSIADIIRSEEKYLDAYEKHPFLTDIKYFFLVFYNIIFKKVRSK